MNIIYMEIDCDSLVQRYLLLKNPLYTFNFPISILIAIIVFGFAKAYKFSDNSYINQTPKNFLMWNHDNPEINQTPKKNSNVESF